MAARGQTRPRTRRASYPRPGEIVWDDALGWGVVVGTGDEGRQVWTRASWDPAIEEAERGDRRPDCTVAWPDERRVTVRVTPVRVVEEPVKLLGTIERSIDLAYDPMERKYGRDSRTFWEAQKRERWGLVTKRVDGLNRAYSISMTRVKPSPRPVR